MYDWKIDEFPALRGYAVCNLVRCGCVRFASRGNIRRSRSYYKARANRGRRHAVRQMLRTGDRVKMPRPFTCWDII